MKKADYIIRRGETLRISLILIEGDVNTVLTVTAILKEAGPNGSVPPLSAPTIETFTIFPVDLPDIGWDFELTDEETSVLEERMYITNAKLDMVDGSVLKTEPILIEVRGSVS